MKQDPLDSADGYHVIVDGRKWRSSDPTVPAILRAELVCELMAARREIYLRRSDADLVLAARARVDDAKHALGERGEPWWVKPTDSGLDERIRSTIRALTAKRGIDKTICASEVARVVASPDWRPAMDRVRDVARDLAATGAFVISAVGTPLNPSADLSGPIRIGRRSSND